MAMTHFVTISPRPHVTFWIVCLQSCPPGVLDFRWEQCAAYNNATYGGKLYAWLPYTDRKNPCALYCIAKGTRTVVRLAPKVLDGTRCKHNTFDMCISGKCWVRSKRVAALVTLLCNHGNDLEKCKCVCV